MSIKYIIQQHTWHTVKTTVVHHATGDQAVIIEQDACDLIDTRGNEFHDGAYRVRQNGKHIKTFKGETAWMDAERLATDLALQAKYGR